MKRFVILCLAAALLCLSGCELPMLGAGREDGLLRPTVFGPGQSMTETEPAVEVTQPIVEVTQPAVEGMYLPLPQEEVSFFFSSGAGAWRTELILDQSGCFYGQFSDSNMGENGEGYSRGTVYVCNFYGKFGSWEQLDANSYRLTDVMITMEQTPGEEWFADQMRFVASDPYGMTGLMSSQPAQEFILYLPDTPLEQLNEEVLSWWPYRFDQMDTPRDTLGCYGLVNTSTNEGFFYCE